MKDTRQGAASIVFIVFYTFTLAFVSYCFFVRRAKRYVFALFLFNIIRLGANIASLGWSIYLWENISWLTAALILGTEGYFALVLAILVLILAYERETFRASILSPDLPAGKNRFLHRFTHLAFYFEWTLIPANVILVVGSALITSGLSDATPAEFLDPSSIPRVNTGQDLRIAGASIFLAAIVGVYALLGWIIYKADDKPMEALWWLVATSPLLILRAIYGVVSAADWKFSYYLPINYGVNGLVRRGVVAETFMGITTEALTLGFLLRALWLVTMPKDRFVAYHKRTRPALTGNRGSQMSETVAINKTRQSQEV